MTSTIYTSSVQTSVPQQQQKQDAISSLSAYADSSPHAATAFLACFISWECTAGPLTYMQENLK